MRPALLHALLSLTLLAPAAAFSAQAESLVVNGQLGLLGEWELSANVSAQPASGNKTFSGSMTLKHVGMCSQEGPQEKAGSVQLQLLGASRLFASFAMDGATCTYRARKSDMYSGMLTCPGKSDVPLLLWIDEPK